MSEEEYLSFKDSGQPRKKLLTPYEEFVLKRLEECPGASAAQVHDWLKEHYKNFIEVNEKTVFNFVLAVRNKYDIPKLFDYRDFGKIEELAYGKQAQVDFGEYNMTTEPWSCQALVKNMLYTVTAHLLPEQLLMHMNNALSFLWELWNKLFMIRINSCW